MRFINTLAALLIFASLQVKADREFGAFDRASTGDARTAVMADAIFDELYNSGALGDIDEETAALTKELTRNLLANPDVMRDIQNGTLKLDEEFVNYAFGSKIKKAASSVKDAGSKVVDKAKDAGGKVIDKTKEVGGKVIDKTKYAVRKTKATFKKVAPKALKTAKDLSSTIAATANKVMTAIVENDKLMLVIEKTVDIASTLAPIVSPILGAALLAIPGGAMLIAPLGALTTALIWLDGSDVTQFLKAVQATTNLLDVALNDGGSVMAAGAGAVTEIGKTVIQAVSEKPLQPATDKEKGDVIQATSKAAIGISNFLARNGDRLSPDEQQKALYALDQYNRLINEKLDPNKVLP